jgi:hypothetical protein
VIVLHKVPPVKRDWLSSAELLFEVLRGVSPVISRSALGLSVRHGRL